ncbi:MAG: hypothetical protein JNM76_03450 [Betaproteobacteria bacterium]|nr:hypothetical protein [Betaproteobacteria bacterium]
MKRAFKWIDIILPTLIVLTAALAALAAHSWHAKPLSINGYHTRVFAPFALTNNELLTQLRMPEGIGDEALWSESLGMLTTRKGKLVISLSFGGSRYSGEEATVAKALALALAAKLK